jgi:hypothetical protein
MKASHFTIGKLSYDHVPQNYTSITPNEAPTPPPGEDAKFNV